MSLKYYLDTFYDWLLEPLVDEGRFNFHRKEYLPEKDLFDECMHDEKINVKAMNLVDFYDKPFGRSDYVDDVAPDILWVEDKLNEAVSYTHLTLPTPPYV